jgi:hypothetical protein
VLRSLILFSDPSSELYGACNYHSVRYWVQCIRSGPRILYYCGISTSDHHNDKQVYPCSDVWILWRTWGIHALFTSLKVAFSLAFYLVLNISQMTLFPFGVCHQTLQWSARCLSKTSTRSRWAASFVIQLSDASKDDKHALTYYCICLVFWSST